jgi:hypothetical protein
MRGIDLRRNTMLSGLARQASIHLEFLGYTISPLEGEKHILRVTHPGRYTFSLSASEQILRFVSYFRMKKIDELGCLRFINSLNLGSVVVCFCKNDFNTLVCQGAFYGGYNKPNFALFLESWDHDMFTTLRERHDELYNYIE